MSIHLSLQEALYENYKENFNGEEKIIYLSIDQLLFDFINEHNLFNIFNNEEFNYKKFISFLSIELRNIINTLDNSISDHIHSDIDIDKNDKILSIVEIKNISKIKKFEITEKGLKFTCITKPLTKEEFVKLPLETFNNLQLNYAACFSVVGNELVVSK